VNAGDSRKALLTCPLMEGLGADVIDNLAGIGEIRTVRAGETVISEGEAGDTLFVILAGRVRTDKRTPFGDPYTVRLLEAGSFFGELSLLDREQRSATVVAETECELLVLDRERFLAFGDGNPAEGLLVTRRLAEQLSLRLRRANEDVVTLFSALVQEVEQRL
jgi:CRP/FNR family transcriptional regulator, cyclic AMP receptor protein